MSIVRSCSPSSRQPTRWKRRLDAGRSNIKGISFREFRLLSALDAAPGEAAPTRVDLARTVGLTASGATRALQPLEKLGFVATTRDTRDARRSRAAPTDQGRRLVAEAAGVVDDTIAGLTGLDDVSADDHRLLLGLLEALPGG